MLTVGTKLGPYEITGSVGAGGMGEVYRARDTRLDRDVAIKVLSAHVSANSDLKARFEREARAIAALNHPHICQLHDIGNQDGVDFLVMEYIEGESLSDRLHRGPVPVPQLLAIGSQVADALDKAHRAGIVHRDLKPGNVMLSRDGAKLLDFGLAKPLAASATGSASVPLLSAAMTMTSPASPLTTQGAIVGTVQYMAPEQIEGKEADARSDIFALGAVLYEMATGKRAFEGKSQISVASAILEKDPDPLSASHPAAPAALDYCIRTCLHKNPDERFQTAHDVRLQLQWVEQSSAATPVASLTAPITASRKRQMLQYGMAAVTVALLVAVSYFVQGRGPVEGVIRAEITAPDKVAWEIVGDSGGPPVLSPDGTKIAYSAHAADSARQLWVRSIESGVTQRLEGTEGASFPFWSPDSRYLGFFANGKLNKVPAAGGPASILAAAGNPRGGTWGVDNTIVFDPDFQGVLYRVSADGANLAPVTKLDTTKHTTHRWPWFLPDGRHFLYLATNHNGGNPAENGIYYAPLDGRESRFLVPSDSGAIFANGYLLFHSQTALMAQKFDPDNGKLSGEAVPIVDKVRQDTGIWRALFSASRNGVLLYQSGSTDTGGSQLVWYDRGGKPLKSLTERGPYLDMSISPDGKKVAVTYGDPSRQVWIVDAERGTKSRLTFDEAVKNAPTWTPDGKSIVYQANSANLGTKWQIRSKLANGSGSETVLAESDGSIGNNPSISPDGRYLVYLFGNGPTGWSIMAMPLSGERKPFTVAAPPTPQANIQNLRVSPNARWVAYASNEAGGSNIFVTAFPHASGKWQVSTDVGDFPAWRGDGKKLYFIRYTDDTLYECDVAENGDEIQIGPPQPLFRANVSAIGASYDVTRDGNRFLVDVAQQETATPFSLVINWPQELKKK